MRKIYFLFLTGIFFFSGIGSFGQVNTYVFTQPAGTYTPITGTTVHASGWDDNVSNIALPFTFTFIGTAYTSVNVSSNGFLTFGATAPGTTNYVPISSGATYSGAVSAFSRDLISNASIVEQTTLGTTPNRQFVVQWNNVRRYSGGAVAGDVLNFQIILNETSNTIQVVYGTCTATSATALNCQVGLRGATNADFNNRSTTTDWSATTAGAANSATCTSSNAIMPVSGLTFMWAPPPPCVAPPGGGTTIGPAGTVCPGLSFVLSVTGASFGTGLTYQWESSLNGTTWTPITGAAAQTLTTNTFVNTYYRRKITCTAVDAYSSSLLVTVSAPVPLPVTEGFNTSATGVFPTCWSQQFVVGTGNNITFETSTGNPTTTPFEGTRFAYWNAFSIGGGNETRLVSPAIVTAGAPSVDVQFYWFNENSAFYNSGAFLLEGVQVQYSLNGTTWVDAGSFMPRQDATLPSGTGQWNFKKITLPAAAGNQPLLLVGFKFHSSFGDNCSLDAATIQATPPCIEPSGLTVSNLTTTTATLSWTASPTNPINGYQWEVRASGAGGSGAAGLAASGVTAAGIITANAVGLTANTAYTYYVRSDCGGTFSQWTQGFAFTTLCGVFSTPFIETFSTYATSFPPSCWTRNDPLLLTGEVPSAYAIGSGSAFFDFYDAPSGTALDLVSPAFTPVVGSSFLTFDHAYATFFFGEVDQLQILYSTDGGANYSNLITYLGGTSGPLNTAGAVIPPFTNPTAAQWASKVVVLPAGTNRLLFRGVSAFGNNLFLDNISITSCLPPTGVNLTALAPTSAALSWTASGSAPANGYQWEVRISGAGGSGAAGLTTSGTTAAGVTTVNIPGLTTFTAYSFYVRSDCGGSDFSLWIGPTVFTTPCNAMAIPFTETFATYATTFPPTCWLSNNATFITGNAATAYGIGLGSAKFDFYNANSGTNLNLESPLFAPVPAGYGLVFDHAYAAYPYFQPSNTDSLRILYSTNAGVTYSNLISYAGGGSGPLNTLDVDGGGTDVPYSPTASQWATKGVAIPAGTNRLLFKGISGFGNNLFLDNITLVTCVPPDNVTALGISPTTVRVSFTPAVGSFIVEYGPPGFVPGTTNAAGVGGTLVFTGSSPVNVTGLTPNTAYDLYVRSICVAGVSYSVNIKARATTLCPATNIPYLQNFESATVPAMPTCTSVEDVNGRSGSFWFGTGGGSWETYTDTDPRAFVSPSKSLIYFFDYNDPTHPADDWFYTQGINLTAGNSYRLKFFYKAVDGVNFPEKMEVKYGSFADAADMTAGTLFTNNNISSVFANSTFDSVRVDFTPASTGVFYFGFHAQSDADEWGILVDDISVKPTPQVDVGITGLTLPALNCPTNGVFLQATIMNFNLTTVNFATYPDTITANITGAGTGTASTILNAGTLAPGASMSVYLSPAFNFSPGGIYNITVASHSPADPEIANDTFRTSIFVNLSPATPVITPSSAQICIGGTPAQLSTQFTASPPPVNLPVVSSGPISIPIPDGNPAGISHTLTVSGIPANASVTAISVTLNVNHTWNSDLIFNLRAPNNNKLNLINSRGGSGDGFTNCIISSTSTNVLPSGNTTPVTGTFAPDGILGLGPTGFTSNVSTFGGLSLIGNGNWTLAISDNVGFDVGTLTSWSIAITYQVITPTITWTPLTGLYTNAGATTAYTGGNAFSLYARPAATTTYTVTASTAAGCTASSTVTVTVNPNPVITIGSIPDTVCISDPIIPLVASPIGGSWTGPGVSGTNFIPPSTGVGTYTLTYTYSNNFGCPATATKTIAVKDCPERIILLRDNAVLLYPNPSNGQFNIKINSVLYNNLIMKVYTNDGLLVRTQQLNGLAWGRVVSIDLTNLPGGVYMVKFYYDGGVRTSEKTFKVILAR